MSLKTRVAKIEQRTGGGRKGIPFDAIYLCELQAKHEETEEGGEPMLAYIMKGPEAGGQLSRNEGETREAFKARVARVVEGLE
ncbi:hypothetical protein M3P21_21110 [Ruegeria sp. 2012CJ41-6]|uniref:Uncharacterized protein n=1 Tax=Ruegeria spongiae TaxID=2942209 RepID=A0ABT0Q819_9RHOB|nr:hypothetical protein [Ruegeria spongiae]MCL6286019.1 hypothetical protein [Ruegeria spongiae]